MKLVLDIGNLRRMYDRKLVDLKFEIWEVYLVDDSMYRWWLRFDMMCFYVLVYKYIGLLWKCLIFLVILYFVI